MFVFLFYREREGEIVYIYIEWLNNLEESKRLLIVLKRLMNKVKRFLFSGLFKFL